LRAFRKEVPPPLIKKIYIRLCAPRPYTNTHQVEKVRATSKTWRIHSTLQISIFPTSLQRIPSDPSLHRYPTARFRFHPSKKPQRNRPTEPKLFLLSPFLTSADARKLAERLGLVMRMIVVASLEWVVREKPQRHLKHNSLVFFPWFVPKHLCFASRSAQQLRALVGNEGNLLVVMIGVARLTSIRPCYAGVHCCTILQVLI
jgi:hypothetical protein